MAARKKFGVRLVGVVIVYIILSIIITASTTSCRLKNPTNALEKVLFWLPRLLGKHIPALSKSSPTSKTSTAPAAAPVPVVVAPPISAAGKYSNVDSYWELVKENGMYTLFTGTAAGRANIFKINPTPAEYVEAGNEVNVLRVWDGVQSSIIRWDQATNSLEFTPLSKLDEKPFKSFPFIEIPIDQYFDNL